MAVRRRQTVPTDSRWPVVDAAVVALSYDALVDTLYVDLPGRPSPSIARVLVGADDAFAGVYPMTHEQSGEVVGIMVEGYLVHAVRVRPAWAALAPLAGVPRYAMVEAGLGPRPPIGRAAAIAAFLADVRTAWDDTLGERAAEAASRG